MATLLFPPVLHAQPAVFTDLGSYVEPTLLVLPITLNAGNEVRWFRIELPEAAVEAGFFDMWTLPIFVGDFIARPGSGLYRNDGNLVAVARPVSDWQQVQLSFGYQDPRHPIQIPDTPDPNSLNPSFHGQNGPLAAGTYWIPLGNDLVLNSTNWNAGSTRPSSDPHRETVLYFHIHPPGFPYCDADFNWDGNVDQDDVAYLINVLAGGENPTGRFPDINRDGNEDMDDLSELIDRIAGGGCP